MKIQPAPWWRLHWLCVKFRTEAALRDFSMSPRFRPPEQTLWLNLSVLTPAGDVSKHVIQSASQLWVKQWLPASQETPVTFSWDRSWWGCSAWRNSSVWQKSSFTHFQCESLEKMRDHETSSADFVHGQGSDLNWGICLFAPFTKLYQT